MSIRLGNGCANCQNLKGNNLCSVHNVKVSNTYTCDSFDMKAELKDGKSCMTCVHYENTSCANPQKAAPGMLCSHWAPQSAA